MTPHEFLLKNAEPCPAWLQAFTKDSQFDREAFFNSRIVYYPGFGSDGHAVKLFGSTHSAHCFVYVDSLQEESQVKSALENTQKDYGGRFKGYQTLTSVQLTPEQLAPRGFVQHASSNSLLSQPQIKPYGFMEVLEREEGFDESHGPKRLAILFLGADGHAAYDALFCQHGQKAPFAILIQDHGFGGNYSAFGKGGLMEQIAVTTNKKPEWLLVAENSEAWDGFEVVPDVEGDKGGMHNMERKLYGLNV